MRSTLLVAYFLSTAAILLCNLSNSVAAATTSLNLSTFIGPQLQEKIIHLPATFTILQFISNDDIALLHMNIELIITVVCLSLAILLLVCGVIPAVMSWGALCIFKCCVLPAMNSDVEGTRAEEMIDQSYLRLPRVTLDTQYIHTRNRLFDVNFTDCAFLIFWMVSWIFRKLTCGIFDSCFILRITRFQVRRMIVGNRRLDMNISDPCNKIPFIYFLNNFCNIYTCGWWRTLGLFHRFYLSRIDRRIFFRPLNKPTKSATAEQTGASESQVVWQNFTEKTSFKWFSIYCGLTTELTYWFLKLLNVFTLFLIGPFVEAWYIRKKVQYSKFGGVGSFAIVSNGSLQALVSNSPKVLRLKNNLPGCSYFTRILIYRLLNFITLGIFGYIVGDRYILGFIDDHLSILST